MNTKYNNWFDSKYYHILYKNRNHKEAKVFIKKLLKHINLNSYSKVLDAGCGKGRHSIEIEKLGHKVTGIDLSNNSIKFAKKFENSNLKFKVHDISKPLNTEFDVVLNLFTSFGYYEREKDLEILLSLEKNLKDNGIGVIDFLNIKTVKVNLVKDEQVIILLSDWDLESDFLDPMCGSGTFLIEAAMLATNYPPNIKRSNFSFKNWNDFDLDLFVMITKSVQSKIKPYNNKISGFDKSPSAISKCNQNIINAGLDDVISISKEDFFRSKKNNDDFLHLVFNPPYGERLRIDIESFYKKIGDKLKTDYSNSNAWFITS
ncbi:class I SAM-dependent methyltransferase, partial [Flavobacteriaceae bacterium]|nr:class I SAM-dependent methyltransferase [Flavobacteriaceae bacterium]